MLWYLLNIAIVTIIWLFVRYEIRDPVKSSQRVLAFNKNALYCAIASFLWIMLSGLRHLSVGADTVSYVNHFFQIGNKSFYSVFYGFIDAFVGGNGELDPGYDIVVKVFHTISQNEHVFLTLVAIIFFVAFAFFIYKNSKNPHLSYIMFSCLFFEFFAITGIRQTLATVMVIFGGQALMKRKKWLGYIIVVLLASTIHASAVCVLPFYWLSKIKINKFTLLVYWIVTVLSFVFRYQLLDLLKIFMNNDRYDQYGQLENAGAGLFMYLLLAIGLVMTLFYKKILNNDTENGQIIIHAIMCAVLFSSLLLINDSFMRVVQYYSIYLVLLVPDLEYIFNNGRDKQIYRLAVGVLLILLLINKNPQYQFFWQNSY